jgi:hypothetical protein
LDSKKHALKPVRLDELYLGKDSKKIKEFVENNWQTHHDCIVEGVIRFVSNILDQNDMLELKCAAILKHAWFNDPRTTRSDRSFAQKYLDAFAPAISKFTARLGLGETESRIIACIASELRCTQRQFVVRYALTWWFRSTMDPLNDWFRSTIDGWLSETCSECSDHREFHHRDPHIEYADKVPEFEDSETWR